jgi:DHA1 family multidrug resistance protein-like MFS transporter
MAADSAPAGRIAQAIGTVQTAQRLGPALGPVLGGVVAGLVGLRTAFLVTAGFYVVALVSMVVLYREPAVMHQAGDAQPARTTFRHVLAFENFVLLLAVTFGLQFVDRSFGPVLPLHVGALGVPEARVPFVAGVVFSVMAVAAAGGHHWCARLLQRMPVSRVIGRAALGAALSVGVLALIDHAWAIVAAAAAFGLGVGVATTATYTAAAGVMPPHARATGFGVMTSASLAGVALSPIISGFVAASSIRLVFIGDALMLCVLALLVPRVMLERSEAAEVPVREDA